LANKLVEESQVHEVTVTSTIVTAAIEYVTALPRCKLQRTCF